MIILEYWKEALAVVTLIVGILAGRKSKDFKEKTEGAGAIAALQNVYDTYIDHNKEVTKDLLDRVKSIEKHNRDLQKNFNDMSFSYANVMDENRKINSLKSRLSKDNQRVVIT